MRIKMMALEILTLIIALISGGLIVLNLISIRYGAPYMYNGCWGNIAIVFFVFIFFMIWRISLIDKTRKRT